MMAMTLQPNIVDVKILDRKICTNFNTPYHAVNVKKLFFCRLPANTRIQIANQTEEYCQHEQSNDESKSQMR